MALWRGAPEDAAKALETASLLDPLGPAVEGVAASLATARGEVQTAHEIISAAWRRWPDSPFIWYLMWTTLCVAKKPDEAEALAAPGVPPRWGVTEHDVGVLRNYTAMLRRSEEGRRQAFSAMLDALAQRRDPLPLSTVLVAAGAGCADQAFDLINAALDSGRDLTPDNHKGFGMARSQAPLQLFVSTGGTPIWRFERFPALAARLGLAQYWVETKQWPDCAAFVDYDFKARLP